MFITIVDTYIVGTLTEVSNLHRDTSIVSWDPPFTLDITEVNPDIIYCIDIYDISCDNVGTHILINCSVIDTSFSSQLLDHDHFIYEYFVTPRINVANAVNGTSAVLKGLIISSY